MASKTSERTRPKYLMGHFARREAWYCNEAVGLPLPTSVWTRQIRRTSHQKECGKGAGARVALKETKGDGFALGKAASIHEP